MKRKERLQKKRKQQKLKNQLIIFSIAVVILGTLGLIVWRETRPAAGTSIAVESADHVPDGEPVDSPTDPPTSGTHYGSPMPAGFYTEESPEYLSGDHDGYLIHSLEHGYVVFWYNCDLLDEQNCTTLLEDIQKVMDDFNGQKLIAFPRPSISSPLVMTSWGQMQEFDSFDASEAEKFIKVNQPRAPEPGAP
jgi:hypothetical protein